MSAKFSRNKERPGLLGKREGKGSRLKLDANQLDLQKPIRYYKHPNGALWIGDAVAWMRELESESVDLVFADPPYNIKKAEWDTFESQQKYADWSLLSIRATLCLMSLT